MNNPTEWTYCPARAQVDLGQVQYADFSKVAVQDYSKVQYFEPTDSEDEDAIEEGKLSPNSIYTVC